LLFYVFIFGFLHESLAGSLPISHRFALLLPLLNRLLPQILRPLGHGQHRFSSLLNKKQNKLKLSNKNKRKKSPRKKNKRKKNKRKKNPKKKKLLMSRSLKN
jgi:hypothetical protein